MKHNCTNRLARTTAALERTYDAGFEAGLQAGIAHLAQEFPKQLLMSHGRDITVETEEPSIFFTRMKEHRSANPESVFYTRMKAHHGIKTEKTPEEKREAVANFVRKISANIAASKSC